MPSTATLVIDVVLNIVEELDDTLLVAGLMR